MPTLFEGERVDSVNKLIWIHYDQRYVQTNRILDRRDYRSCETKCYLERSESNDHFMTKLSYFGAIYKNTVTNEIMLADISGFNSIGSISAANASMDQSPTPWMHQMHLFCNRHLPLKNASYEADDSKTDDTIEHSAEG